MIELDGQLDSLDGIDAKFHGLYIKNGEGKFVLDVAVKGSKTQADVDAVLRAKQQESQQAATLRQQLQAITSVLGDITPEQAAKIIKDHTEQQTKKLMEKGEYETLLQQIKDQTATKVSAAETERTEALSQLERHLITAEVASAISEHKADKDLLEMPVKARLKVVAENGERVVRVMSEDGKTPMLSLKGDGSMMGVTEFVGTFREKGSFAKAFPAPKVGGSGAENVINNGSVVVNSKADLKSDAAKSKYITDNGLDAYLALP
jgi:hypothetical protein